MTNFYYFTTAPAGTAEYSNLKQGFAFWVDKTATSVGNDGSEYPCLIRLIGDLGSSSKIFSIPSRSGQPFLKTTGNNEVECHYPKSLLKSGLIKCYYFGSENGVTGGNA